MAAKNRKKYFAQFWKREKKKRIHGKTGKKRPRRKKPEGRIIPPSGFRNKKGRDYLRLVEVAYPQAKMMATIVRKPIQPIKLGLEPTNL